MSDGNADSGRRMDRPTAQKVIADLTKFADWEPADSPRAAAMREAADVLRQLAPRQSDSDQLEDTALQAVGFRLDVEHESKQLRIAFFKDRGQKGLLGYMVLECPEIYDLGTDLIRRYDQLEGIE
jgi:hypothetical protein